MKKPSDVVMLPTEKAKNIPVIQYFNDNTQSLDYWNSEVVREYPIEGKTVYEANCIVPQHLYFLSDDEIKEGDWVLFNNTEIVKCIFYKNGEYEFSKGLLSSNNHHISHFKKIIATTDEFLTIKDNVSIFQRKGLINIYPTEKSLPRPSNEFLKKFCELGGVDKVLVEYESYVFIPIGTYYVPKVAPDNTITIYPI